MKYTGVFRKSSEGLTLLFGCFQALFMDSRKWDDIGEQQICLAEDS
jgi:hypothetical protein